MLLLLRPRFFLLHSRAPASTMHLSLFTMQALKFGNDKEACLKAIDIGFELAPRPNNAIYKGALKTLQMVSISLACPC